MSLVTKMKNFDQKKSKVIVLKFGGSCIKEPSDYLKIADVILLKKKLFERVLVVVSAMNGVTDRLVELANQVHENPPKREQDMLLSIGERMSIALLAMALQKKGQEAISFTGSQSGIITSSSHANARIIDVRPQRILEALQENKVVIIAGFQGMSLQKEITTLGRGGSDTTAVALAISLRARRVEFFKDVKGFFEQDPKVHPQSPLYESLSFLEALKLAQEGAKVMHPRAIQLAMENSIELWIEEFNQALNTKQTKQGTVIRSEEMKWMDPVYEGEKVCI